MTPAELEKELKAGKIRPLYLVAGEERFLVEQVTRALYAACVDPSLADFNVDLLTAGDADIDRVINAARTVPMMSERRFVVVRALERWEGKTGDDTRLSPFDRLAEYAEKPISSTCLVLSAGKLDNRRRLAAMAKKAGFLVNCELLDRRALKGWIEKAAKDRGHALEPGVAEHLAQIAGPELGYVSDAVERLSLYVGAGQRITADAVSQVVARVRETEIWDLSSAVGSRDLRKALSILDQVYTRGEGVLLVATLASSIRKLWRFSLALDAGSSPEEAVKLAALPPFKAGEAKAQVRALSTAELERWMRLLAEADAALKSSRRPERATLDWLILELAGRPASGRDAVTS
jgi:DNA polymerase-3 subunit delta